MKRLIMLATTLALLAGCTTTEATQQNIWGDPSRADDSYRFKVSRQCNGDSWDNGTLMDRDAEQSALGACRAHPKPWCTITAVRIEDRDAGTDTTIDCDQVRS